MSSTLSLVLSPTWRAFLWCPKKARERGMARAQFPIRMHKVAASPLKDSRSHGETPPYRAFAPNLAWFETSMSFMQRMTFIITFRPISSPTKSSKFLKTSLSHESLLAPTGFLNKKHYKSFIMRISECREAFCINLKTKC